MVLHFVLGIWRGWDRNLGNLRSSKDFGRSTQSHICFHSPNPISMFCIGGEEAGELSGRLTCGDVKQLGARFQGPCIHMSTGISPKLLFPSYFSPSYQLISNKSQSLYDSYSAQYLCT